MDRFRFAVVDRFYADAARLRRTLEARLSDRRDPFDRSRFEWESWHVPGQFSQLRTPAREFFGDDALAFERALTRSLARELGPLELASPPWLSILRDRDFQALHRDSPNGEFAFSFGLGQKGRFRGGETLIAKDQLLDYFGQGAHRDEAAADAMFDDVAPALNRLVVFDARLPHAVREVEGPREARCGRIAIQGWLRCAEPIAERTSVEDAKRAVARAVRGLRVSGAEGIAVVEVRGREGKAARVDVRAHTLADIDRGAGAAAVLATLERALKKVALPKAARVVVSIKVSRGTASGAW